MQIQELAALCKTLLLVMLFKVKQLLQILLLTFCILMFLLPTMLLSSIDHPLSTLKCPQFINRIYTQKQLAQRLLRNGLVNNFKDLQLFSSSSSILAKMLQISYLKSKKERFTHEFHLLTTLKLLISVFSPQSFVGKYLPQRVLPRIHGSNNKILRISSFCIRIRALALNLSCLSTNNPSKNFLGRFHFINAIFVEHSLQFRDLLSCFPNVSLILPLCYPKDDIQIFLGIRIESNKDFPKVVGTIS